MSICLPACRWTCIPLSIQRQRLDKKSYIDVDVDEEEANASKRAFSVEDKLESDKFGHEFVSYMVADGK